MRAIARLYVVQKEYDKAEAQFRKVVQNDPNDLETRTELGDFYAGKKRSTDGPKQKYADVKRRNPALPAVTVSWRTFILPKASRTRR